MSWILSDRYQEQPWFVRLWRRRWFIAAALWTVKWTLKKSMRRGLQSTWKHFGNPRLSLRRIIGINWTIAKVEACRRMKWWHTGDEAMEILDA